MKVDMQGTVASIPADRAHVSGTAGELGWLGIRPEKVLIARGRRGHRRPGQQHHRRRGQRRQLRRRQHPVPGPDAVGPGDPGLRAEHRPTAAVPAGRAGRHLVATGVRLPARRTTRTPRAGVDREDAGSGRVQPRALAEAIAAARSRRPEKAPTRKLTGYWLLLPGALWLVVFFVVPLYSLVATSLYDPDGSRACTGYEMTWHVQQLLRRAAGLLAAAGPVALVRAASPP